MTIPAVSMIELSATKTEYTKYEPLLLTMELYGTLHENEHFVNLENMASSYELEVQYENESSFIYRPFIRGEGLEIGEIDSVLYTTIIKSGDRIITDKAGYYRLQLKYKHGDRYASNPLIIKVFEAKTIEEKRQLEEIIKNKNAYAQYINLEGGEHNAQGHELFKSLAEKEGAYGRIANEYLALNYSQDFFDIKGNGKKGRLRNIDIANKHISKIEGSSNEILITMKAVRNFLTFNKGKTENVKVKKMLNKIDKRAKQNKFKKSRIYRNLFR